MVCLICSLFSSPVVWKKSRQQGVWSLITQEESAQLEAAMRTNQKSITIADEIVSKVSYITVYATMQYVCILRGHIKSLPVLYLSYSTNELVHSAQALLHVLC